MKCKTSWFLIVAAVVAMFVRCLADTASLPKSEVAELEKFFNEFIVVRNNMDVEGVKKMAGSEWERFSRGINHKIKIEKIEIVDITIDKSTNVVTKVIEVSPQNESFSAEVIFMMRKDNGVYLIDKIRLPEAERLHEEFETANQNFEKLITAIKGKDIGKVKEALPFGGVADFDAELSARGLSWIMDAANSDVVISGGWGVRRSGKDGFVGHVEISSKLGGTNVLHEVIFKGLQIDRAVPRQETSEEFRKRTAAERAAARKQYREKRIAEYKRQNAEALERLKKELKEAGILK